MSNTGPLGAINQPGHGRGGINNNQAAPQPQPNALPGSKPATAAAPATRLPTDMSPNDAMFDAINRGDVAAARDALNRGADMDARNILGMTPMELSVDLGRNDISFLLLSLRPEDRGAVSTASAALPGPSSGKQPPAKRVSAHQKKAAQAAPVRRQELPPPRLFANDGGTPNPSAGFLGFGPTNGGR
jgi:hypothetical protein